MPISELPSCALLPESVQGIPAVKRPRPFNIQRTAITSPETCVGRRLLHANCHSFRVGSGLFTFRCHGDSQPRVNHLVGGTVIRQHNVITSRPMVDCSRILTATRPKIRRTHRRWCGSSSLPCVMICYYLNHSCLVCLYW